LELKNKIDLSLRNIEVRAYMLHDNTASSQATEVIKTCQINTIFNRQTCCVKGKKFFPLAPQPKDKKIF
jgi:hypothetical protein